MTEQINIDELERLAKAVEGWKLDCSWTDTSEDTPASVVGCIDEDGRTYPVATIDCDQYSSDDSGQVADFYAAANPATVLTLISQLRAVGDRAMHLERRLSDANGEVLRLRGADQHALRLQAGHDEAVLKIDEARQRATDAEQIATARGHTINGLRNELQAVKVERDELASKLSELEGQEPITVEWPTYPYESMVSGLEGRNVADHYEAMLYGWERGVKQAVDALPDSLFYARPVPAEPVNARLVEALLKVARMAEDLKRPCGMDPESSQAIRNGLYMNISYVARAAIAAAEAQQAEPVRLTGDQLEDLVKWYGEEPEIWLDRREYTQTIQEEVLRANGYKVEG